MPDHLHALPVGHLLGEYRIDDVLGGFGAPASPSGRLSSKPGRSPGNTRPTRAPTPHYVRAHRWAKPVVTRLPLE